jgi:hypothetical protein
MVPRPVATTRAKTSTSTTSAPARGGEHVVDQDQPTALDIRLPLWGHPERALHIDGALALVEADLLRGGADPLQGLEQNRHARNGGNRVRERCGLIEPARPQPAPMQRDRHERIGIGGEFPPGTRHPAAHHGRKIEPVAVFEAVHQFARDVVVTDGGAGAIVGGRVGDRLRRQEPRTGIVGEGNAETRAVGRLDEMQFRPAFRAQGSAIAQRHAAGGAQRRQCGAECETEGAAQRRECACEARSLGDSRFHFQFRHGLAEQPAPAAYSLPRLRGRVGEGAFAPRVL